MCSQIIRGVWLVTRGEVEEGRGAPGDLPGACGTRGPHGGITGFGVGLGVGGQNVVGDTVGLCDCGVGRGVGLGVGGGLGSATQHPVFRAVGTRDGAALGALVGPGAGPGVGPSVGPTVGETVGARVGSCEPRTLYTYFGEDSPRSLRPPTSMALQLVNLRTVNCPAIQYFY